MRWAGQLLLLTSLLLVGCGFHLRGVISQDSIRWLNHIAIVIQQAHRDIEPLLREQLKAYNIDISDDPALAKYWLIIDNETMDQNITSISSSTTPRQYQLIYTVQFKLQRAKGAEVFPSSRVIVTRQITLNSNRILGSSDEEALQKNEMRRDAVIQIINRLSREAPDTLHYRHQPTSKTEKHVD